MQRRERLLGHVEPVEDFRQVIGRVDEQTAAGLDERGGFARQVEPVLDLIAIKRRLERPRASPAE